MLGVGVREVEVAPRRAVARDRGGELPALAPRDRHGHGVGARVVGDALLVARHLADGVPVGALLREGELGEGVGAVGRVGGGLLLAAGPHELEGELALAQVAALEALGAAERHGGGLIFLVFEGVEPLLGFDVLAFGIGDADRCLRGHDSVIAISRSIRIGKEMERDAISRKVKRERVNHSAVSTAPEATLVFFTRIANGGSINVVSDDVAITIEEREVVIPVFGLVLKLYVDALRRAG